MTSSQINMLPVIYATVEDESPYLLPLVKNFPCQTLKISKVSLVVTGS
jgi:hypothetical protein